MRRRRVVLYRMNMVTVWSSDLPSVYSVEAEFGSAQAFLWKNNEAIDTRDPPLGNERIDLFLFKVRALRKRVCIGSC